MKQRILSAVFLALIAALPPLAGWWEASLLRHMLGQIPLLILSGVLLAPVLLHGPDRADKRQGALAAVLLAAFCIIFWTLPRWLDAAVNDAATDLLKTGSLIGLAGLPLGWGWPRLGTIARGFILVQVIGMLAVLGVLYRGYPERLCNNYLFDEQSALGMTLLLLAGLVGVLAASRTLIGQPPQTGRTGQKKSAHGPSDDALACSEAGASGLSGPRSLLKGR